MSAWCEHYTPRASVLILAHHMRGSRKAHRHSCAIQKKKSLSSLWTVHRPHACHLIARHAQCQPQRSLRYMFTDRSLSCSHKYARLCWLILLQLQLDEPYEQLINLNNDQHASATERLSPPTCLRQIVLQLQFGSVHHHTLKRWETGCTHTQAQDHSDALLQRELLHQEERAQQQWETDCLPS